MKRKLLRHWWILLLGLAIVCAPFALKLQNARASGGMSMPPITLSSSDQAQADTVRRMIAALADGASAEEVAAARNALDALSYRDRYDLAGSAARLDALEAALASADRADVTEIPLETEAVPPPQWTDGDTRLEILLHLLPPELDVRMADLLHTAYQELDDPARAALPQEVLARYLASQEGASAPPPGEAGGVEDVSHEDAPPPLSSGSWMGSKNSDKYHDPACTSAKRIKSENVVWFSSTADAKSRGYSPCSICSPS